MSESDAKQYWRDFEKLVLLYLREKYNIQDEKYYKLTPPTADGGYDGVIYIPNDSIGDEIQKLLFEAKLRSNINKSLPMNDFSKSLIMAVNKFADGIYIATNLHFSEETLHQLDLYATRTGLYINTITGKELYQWFEQEDKRRGFKYDVKFINFLKESSNIDYDIPIRFLEDKTPQFKYVEDMIRKQSISQLIENIVYKLSGIVLITGSRGCGKSSLSYKVKASLINKNYYISDIDLGELSTSRAVFLRFIEIIWGISPAVILSCSEEEFKAIFSDIGNNQFSEREKNCLRKIFSIKVEDFREYQDIYKYILIEMLKKLLYHYTGIMKYCVHVENLDCGYFESVDFLLTLIRATHNLPITYLIELNEDEGEKIHISCAEWNSINKELNNFDNIIEKYKVRTLSNTEKKLIISNKFINLSHEQIDVLLEFFPNNPLILMASMDILKGRLKNDFILTAELKYELEYFNNSYHKDLINEMIKRKFQVEGFNDMIIPTAILVLLNGTCSISNLSYISGMNENILINNFMEMEIFYVDYEKISLKHNFYLNNLQEFSFISRDLIYKVAEKMLININIFYSDALEKELLNFRLLLILKRKEPIITNSVLLGKTLLKQGDFKQAYTVLRHGYQLINDSEFININYEPLKLQILQNMYEILLITDFGEKDTVLNELYLHLKYSRKKYSKHITYIEAYASYLLFELKRCHIQSNHLECLKKAYAARRYARKNNLYEIMPQLLSKILMMKSLSVKHVHGLHACIQSFQNDTKKNPNMAILEYSYNTHKTGFVSADSPQISLKYFKLNQKYYLQLPISDQLHNRVNIANMYFLMKEYEKAENLSLDIVNDSITYNICIELGRIYNLLGNVYIACVNKNKSNAREFYQKSINIFKKINHSIHLWPPLINLSNMDYQRQDYEQAYSNLQEAVNILELRKDELSDTAGSKINRSSKLYVGTIIALHNLYLLAFVKAEAKVLYDDFYANVKTYLPKDIETIIKSEELYVSMFKDTTYYHTKNILLKL